MDQQQFYFTSPTLSQPLESPISENFIRSLFKMVFVNKNQKLNPSFEYKGKTFNETVSTLGEYTVHELLELIITFDYGITYYDLGHRDHVRNLIHIMVYYLEHNEPGSDWLQYEWCYKNPHQSIFKQSPMSYVDIAVPTHPPSFFDYKPVTTSSYGSKPSKYTPATSTISLEDEVKSKMKYHQWKVNHLKSIKEDINAQDGNENENENGDGNLAELHEETTNLLNKIEKLTIDLNKFNGTGQHDEIVEDDESSDEDEVPQIDI